MSFFVSFPFEAAIADAEKEPCEKFRYAVILKDGNKLIGGCEIALREDYAYLGWILHKDYWKQGCGTEFGRELLRFGFEELGVRRIIASCDAENYGSYRVMERIGMRREGLLIEGRPANKLTDRPYSDEFEYAILKDEWEARREAEFYNGLPVKFDGFIDVPELSDGVTHLVCLEKTPANSERKHVPGYKFAICRGGERIGYIDLRIGYSDGLYFAGQIGYAVDEKYRGNGYAGRACRLVLPVARAHGMERLLITTSQDNKSSQSVCEKLGARRVRVARLPEWHERYKDGVRWMIYEWNVLSQPR